MTACPKWCVREHDATPPFHHDGAPRTVVSDRGDHFYLHASQWVGDPETPDPVGVSLIVNSEGPYALARCDAVSLSLALIDAAHPWPMAQLGPMRLVGRLRAALWLIRCDL